MEKTAAAKHSADYRARLKAEKNRMGIETFKVEVPVGINKKLLQLMKSHGFENRQELYQTIVLYLVNAPATEAARILTPAPSGFVVTQKLARQLQDFAMSNSSLDEDE